MLTTVLIVAYVCVHGCDALQSSCFTAHGAGASYSDGTWHLANHSGVRTARLKPRNKEEPWVSCSVQRDYGWRPNCHLKHMEKPELCTLLDGKFVLFVETRRASSCFCRS